MSDAVPAWMQVVLTAIMAVMMAGFCLVVIAAFVNEVREWRRKP